MPTSNAGGEKAKIPTAKLLYIFFLSARLFFLCVRTACDYIGPDAPLVLTFHGKNATTERSRFYGLKEKKSGKSVGRRNFILRPLDVAICIEKVLRSNFDIFVMKTNKCCIALIT